MIRRPPRSTPSSSFPTRRSSDLSPTSQGRRTENFGSSSPTSQGRRTKNFGSSSPARKVRFRFVVPDFFHFRFRSVRLPRHLSFFLNKFPARKINNVRIKIFNTYKKFHQYVPLILYVYVLIMKRMSSSFFQELFVLYVKTSHLVETVVRHKCFFIHT